MAKKEGKLMGQRVRVRVLGADRLQRTIDFEFCEENE